MSDSYGAPQADGLSSATPIEPASPSRPEASIPSAADWYPLKELDGIASEAFDRWDKDMRSGKLMLALSGDLPRYRKDVTSVRTACAVAPGMLSLLRSVHILARREGTFATAPLETLLDTIRGFTAPDEIARMFTDMTAQAIETRSAVTAGHSPKGESEVAKPCAQGEPS